jgi:hypothetical protein
LILYTQWIPHAPGSSATVSASAVLFGSEVETPFGVVSGTEVATFSGVVSGTKIYKQISILQNTMTPYDIELYDDAN